MSGSASLGLEQAILGHTLGFAPLALPAHVYVGLCSAALAPAEATGGIEIAGGGYIRQPATFALASSPANVAANTTTIEWPVATAPWGAIGYFELWDAQAGGNRLYWGAIVDPGTSVPLTIDVETDDIVRFSAGTLSVGAGTAAGGAGVASFNTRTGDVVLTGGDITGAGGALLAGPQVHTGAHTFTVTPGTAYVTLNGNAPAVPPAPANGTLLHLVGIDGGGGSTTNRVFFDTFGATASLGFRRAQGTAAAPLPLAVSTPIMNLQAFGYGDAGYSTNARAQYVIYSADVWSDTSQPTYHQWTTTAVGGTTGSAKMSLSAAGNLLLGVTITNDLGYILDVAATRSSRIQVTSGTTPFVVTGTPATAPPAPFAGTGMQLVGGAGQNRIELISPTGANNFVGRRSEGTLAVPTATAANSTLTGLAGAGHTGVAWTTSNSVIITFQAAALWSTTSTPTQILFNTTPIGSLVNAEAMRVTASGNLLIGTTTEETTAKLDVAGASRFRVAPGAQWVTITGNTLPATPVPPANVMLQVTGLDGTSTRLNMDAFGAAPSNYVSFRRSDGTSAVPTPVPTNTTIGGLQWFGHDGGGYTVSPRASLTVITPTTGGAWTGASNPTALQFQVTNVGSTTMAEAMRIAPSGNLLLGTTTDGVFKLDVVGATRLLGDVVTGGKSGFNGTTPITKPTVTGAKGGNAALASLIAALAAYGLITDTTTA